MRRSTSGELQYDNLEHHKIKLRYTWAYLAYLTHIRKAAYIIKHTSRNAFETFSFLKKMVHLLQAFHKQLCMKELISKCKYYIYHNRALQSL